jgi:hypothetical protein
MLARTLIASLTALTALTAVAEAQYYPRERPYRPEPAPRFAGCVVFEHANFGGARLPVRPGQFSFVGPGWNDRISSIQCTPGCRMVAYEHANFGGARQGFSTTAFVGQFWNDRISSAEVACR